MADIIIKRSASGFGNSNETSVEITGADYINDGLVTAILDRMNGKAGHGFQCSEEDIERPEQTDGPVFLNLRNVVHGAVTPEVLAAAIEDKCLRQVIQTYGEIDIILDTGELTTVVCAYLRADFPAVPTGGAGARKGAADHIRVQHGRPFWGLGAG